MSVLTDLYEDPEMAIIREYSTNALDAHVEVGEPRPIEVTTPSTLSPLLRVKDRGPGLTADDIRDIYSKYGTSTKRNSNDVVGMLGLGCKSALTYTDQFTVTSVKDETLTTVSVSRDADGGASFHIVNQEQTSEPNGTEVIIPAKRGNDIAAKAAEFFQYWKPGTVLLNGKEPERIEGIKITDDVLLVPSSSWPPSARTDIIVMGNVPYPAHIKPLNLGNNSKIVAWVDIGTVAFTPSREALQDTKRNREAITAVQVAVDRKLQTALQARIDEAPNMHEAAKAYLEVARHGYAPAPGPAWRGQAIPTQLKRPLRADWKPGTVLYPDGDYMMIPGQKTYRRKDGDRYQSVSLMNAVAAIWIENFDNVGFSPTMREKLTTYRAEHRPDDEQIEAFILVDKVSPDERKLLRDDQVWDWTPISEIKITRKTPDGTSKPRGSYLGRAMHKNHVSGDMELSWAKPIMADTIDTSKPIYWHHGNRWETQGHIGLRMAPEAFDDKGTIIALPANRIDKFLRDFPTAKKMDDVWTAHVKDFYKKLSENVRLKLSLDTTQVRFLKLLDANQVDDPELQDWIVVAKTDIPRAVNEKYAQYVRYVQPPESEEAAPFENYPLVDGFNYYDVSGNVDHLYLYLNAAYAAERKAP